MRLTRPFRDPARGCRGKPLLVNQLNKTTHMGISSRTRLLALSLLLAFASLSAYAQNVVVRGMVKDNEGETLVGASVLQKGTTNGTTTDINGEFSLSVPGNSSLVISYIGYQTATVGVNGRSSVNVALKPEASMLDEVVAIGYGTVKKRDLTGAVSSVTGAELTKVPVTSAAAALQGKAAGVNIVSQSSAPGAGLNITVRGGTSITQSTEPLYIVDGFEMSNALTNIDINDIESIDVLKDASSTAIYGAKGSNGIIVITTKSAAKGKTKVDYNAYFSFDVLSKKLSMVNNAAEYVAYQYEYAELNGKTSMWSLAYDNDYGVDMPDFYSGVYGRIASNYGDSYAIDWQDEAFGGSALTQSHNVSVSTGTDRTQMLISYNYTGQDGLLANHDYQRHAIRTKINSELWKGVNLDFGMFFYNNVTRGGGAYSGMKNVLLQPINGGTLISQDDLLNTQTYATYRGLDNGFDTPNPLVQNEASTSESRSRRLEVNAGVNIDICKYLKWRTAANYVANWGKSTSFSDENSTSYLIDQANTGMEGSISNSEGYSWNIANTLTYNQTYSKLHNLTVMLGQEYSYSESESNGINLKQFPYPNHGLDDISNANVSSKSSGHSHGNMLSFFGRASYNFSERYLLTATVRADGSSKFAKGHKWGVFPSASGAWRVSQERFWQDSKVNDWFTNLKVRVGYGVTGNCNISSNLYTTNVSQTTYPMGNNENDAAYVVSSTLGNANLKWETLHATNVGIDLGFVNNRFNFSVDWYNNQISDMLMQCSIPKSSGYTYQYQNVGSMRNRGWEVQFNSTNIITRSFQWSTTLNLSFNKSKVLSLEGDLDYKTFSVGGNRSGTVTYYARVGDSLGDMYGYVYDGIYTTDDFYTDDDGNWVLKQGVVRPYEGTAQPGDIKFAADNDDPDDPQFTRKLVKIGNGAPFCTGGFGNTFTYKGFDLNIFLKFSIGNDIYNATKHSLSPYASYQNVPTEFADNYYRLIDPNTGQMATDLVRLKELNPDEYGRTWSLATTNINYITYASSYYVEDGSYLRLAQVTLGYTFPKKWMQKVHVQNLRIYFTGNNLATITGYSGYNPDASSANSDVICTPGYDSSTYPLSRSFVLGINLTF